MKIMLLNFKNAAWFFRDISKYDEKDFVSDNNGNISRKEINKQYKEPITVHHVSNVLHVLFGERPSASLRETYIQEIPEIKNMASDGWIKLNNYFWVGKNDFKPLFKEKLKTKKSVWNSWDNSNCLLYWERIKKFLGDDLNKEFIDLLKSIYKTNNLTEKPVQYYLNSIRENQLENANIKMFLNKLLKTKKTPLYNAIVSGISKNKEFNLSSKTMITTISSVSDIVKLSGKIIIPIYENKWLEKLKNFQGVATILDGGIVTIDKIISDYELTDDVLIEYTPINTISSNLIN